MFSRKILKISNAALDVDANLYPVNNFFCSLGKINKYIEIWHKQKPFVDNNTTTGPYVLGHLAQTFANKHAKMIENDLMFSKIVVNYPANSDRRCFHSNNNKDRTDNNPEDRTGKFGLQIVDKYVYRVPVKYFYDLGKIIFPTKINMKIQVTLETEMKNVQRIFTKVSFLQYEQILLMKNFRQ